MIVHQDQCVSLWKYVKVQNEIIVHIHTSDPPIDGHVRLQIRVVNHAFDIFGIHFYNKVSDSKDEYLDCLERAEQSIQLELSLGIPAFYARETDRAKVVWVALAILLFL